jgi:hypothetical protein
MKLMTGFGYTKLLTKLSLALAGSSLILGAMLYVMLRSADPVFFRWIRFLGFGDKLTNLREHSLTWVHIFPSWFIYSLPNGLCAFAYTLIVFAIWLGSSFWVRYIWYATIPLLVFGFELLQLTGIISGTFCLWDMAFGAGGIFIGWLINNKKYLGRIRS